MSVTARKTTIAICLILVLTALSVLTGCGSKTDVPETSSSQEGAAEDPGASVDDTAAGEVPDAAADGAGEGAQDAAPDAAGGQAAGENSADGGTSGVADSSENSSAQSAAAIEAVPVTDYSFSLGFAGDICFADNYIPMQHLAEIGSDDISDGIDPEFISLMRGMDLMWINNEFVYSDRGEPLPGKAWTFRSATEHVKYLVDLGIDVAGLANNHCYDYGEEAFLDTMDTIEGAGIPFVGAGRDLKEAMTPVYLETDGFTIAYVAASNCEYTIYTPEATDDSPGILWCYEYDRFLDVIREAAANADYVVALPHWGMEHTTELTSVQIDGAHMCIDAGADAVIGTHPHILQGIEYYNGKPIMYSLGNFWFDGYDIDTAVAELRFKGERSADGSASLGEGGIEVIIHPGTQSGVYTAYADNDGWRRAIFDHLEAISSNIYIDDEGVVRSL